MAEGGKRQKTIDNIDKIIQQGQQFYQDTADSRKTNDGFGQNHGTREQFAVNGTLNCNVIEEALFGYLGGR